MNLSDKNIHVNSLNVFSRAIQVVASYLAWEKKFGKQHAYGRLWGAVDAIVGVNAFPLIRHEHPRVVLAIALAVALEDDRLNGATNLGNKFRFEARLVNSLLVRVSFPVSTWGHQVKENELQELARGQGYGSLYTVSILNAQIIHQDNARLRSEQMLRFLKSQGVG